MPDGIGGSVITRTQPCVAVSCGVWVAVPQWHACDAVQRIVSVVIDMLESLSVNAHARLGVHVRKRATVLTVLHPKLRTLPPTTQAVRPTQLHKMVPGAAIADRISPGTPGREAHSGTG